jgi:predicted AAA+ superfamily ATPase
LNVEFENYLSKQFIETVNITDNSFVQEYVLGIIKKIVFEDIPIIFPVENPEILYAIVKIIAENPGIYLHALFAPQSAEACMIFRKRGYLLKMLYLH